MIVSVENISKSFGHNKVLDQISFKLESGQLLLITGENGSGKSTLFRILSGLISQDEGTFTIKGPLSLSPASEHDFFPNATMKENLLFFAGIYGVGNKIASERMDHYLRDFNIENMLSSPFQELSTGNKKKFSLVRTLIIEPKVLLLDEVLGPIDQKSRPEIFAYIKNWIEKHQACALLSTHSLQDDYLAGFDQLLLKKPLQ